MISTVARNPYVIGRPIDDNDQELFVGRRNLFRFIEDNLRNKAKVMIVYGQRRIGKSSFLNHIPKSVNLDNFAFVPFDLQSYSHKSLGEVLEELAIEILESLALDSPDIPLPDRTALATDTSLFYKQFLPQVFQSLGNQNIALLLDEFETLNAPDNTKDNHLLYQHLFPYLKSLVARQDNLYLILCVEQQSKDLPNLLQIFKDAPTQEIGLLDQQTTQELITKPAAGLLTYETAAIEAIYNLSAGHPYFTQVLCFAIFSRARELEQWQITPEDVENSVDQALENASAGLAGIRAGLSIPERVVLSAFAEADNTVNNSYKNSSDGPLQPFSDELTSLPTASPLNPPILGDFNSETPQSWGAKLDPPQPPARKGEPYSKSPLIRGEPYSKSPLLRGEPYSKSPLLRGEPYSKSPLIRGEPYSKSPFFKGDLGGSQSLKTRPRGAKLAVTLLEHYGVIQTNSLMEALDQLAKRGFLDKTKQKITIEFIRRWLIKRYPLQQEILELEKLGQEQTNPIYQQATTQYQQGEITKALRLYEQVLELNPNHFSAVFALAEGYLDSGKFYKAVTYYKRAYKVDQICNKDGLVRSLLNYGNQLIEQQELKTAKKQFKQVLEIEQDNLLALEKLLEIEYYQKLDNSEKLDKNTDSSGMTGELRYVSNYQNLSQWNWLGKIVAAVAIISLVGVGFYNVSKPCPTGAQKVFGIRCVVTTISRGEHSLFPRIDNKDKFDKKTFDRATEAFQNQNYNAAAQGFSQAWQDNPNDPEFLIYYNNARARQQGLEPFTIAVVVPIDQSQSTAKEILRGVAEAQDQFNNSEGLNGRFLEIAIANDGNDPAQAKKIAQALVKDKSILGVIGHNSSDATKAAIPVYDKAGLGMISSTSASSDLTSLDVKKNVFFRTVASNQALGKKLAQHVKTQPGLDQVVIFYDAESAYSKSLNKDFQSVFENLGGKVVREIDLNNRDLNITEEVKRSLYQDQVKAAMLFPSVEYINTAVNIAKANANLNPNPNNQDQQGLKLFGGDTLNNYQTLKEGGQAVEGLTIAVPWFRESRDARNFSTAARELWKGEVNWRTATSFDATQAFIQALFQDADRELVLDRLRNIKLSPNETSGLPLQFNNQGERESEPVLVEVVDGKFKLK
ncbi:ABC transporter substrate-binding protein [Moorena sp. SIO4A1]|uniref:ABC transporter substrate-binding protein n=1 Tax=Moorena sp. SIO4A1 TaxID=2607835 RepID=UPI00260033A2|nr:ABC transporter substrate-binding protein [Moorena sp. SIO4A1]